jgi:hypothetical protein
VIDLAILVALALGAFTGWRRGFIAPFVAASGALVGLYALYAGPGATLVPSGIPGIGLGVMMLFLLGSVLGMVGSVIAGLLTRIGAVQRANHVLGVPLGGLTSLVLVYAGLYGIVTVDTALAPLHGNASVDAVAVAAVKATVEANPALRAFVDPASLDELATSVAKAAVPKDQLAQFNQILAFYELEFRPQLLSSALAPIVLAVGERLPVLGHHVEFPKK